MPGRNKFFLFLFLVAFTIVVSYVFSVDPAGCEKFFNSIPKSLSYGIFIFSYVAGTFIADLKDPLRLVGALLYGAYLSTLLIYFAELINLGILFHLSKFLGRNYVESKLQGKAKNIYERLENLTFGQMIALRMVPFISYRVIDLGFGLTKVRFGRYFLAAVIGSLPRIFWIQYPLASIRSFSVEKTTEYFNANPVLLWSYFAYTVVITVITCVLYAKIFKQEKEH